MAAVLRQAATRMLQRTPAAAAAAQRLRRLVLFPGGGGGGGSPSAAFSSSAAASKQVQTPAASLPDLHRRKQELSEELYDVLAEMEKGILGKYYKPRGLLFSTKNSELLCAVTEHVQARPNDPDWRWFRGKQRYESVLAGITSLGFFCLVWLHDFHEIRDWLAPKETALPSAVVICQISQLNMSDFLENSF